MATSSVSIIVPAHNAKDHLEHCLQALEQECTGHEEIIVVDDASTDDTAALAKRLGARVFTLSENGGPSRARNLGAAEATGEVLLFVDADVAVHPGTLERVRTFLENNPDTAALFGSYDANPREEGTLTQYRNLVHHFVHQQGRPEASTFWAGCGAIRRKIFRDIGGYDALRFPRCIEDIEMGYRMRQQGYTIRLDRELLCTHLKRWTFFSLIKTDVFCRAVPWAKLIFERRFAPDDLNIKKSQKLSVILVGLALLALPLAALHLGFLLAAAVACILAVLLNAKLFKLFYRKHGAGFALQCIPLHLLYFLYSGLCYLYVWGAQKLGIKAWDGNCGS
ncbi:MAG: glycosyltransferase family 2 protein [Planctomycetota bacterium]